MKRRLLKVICVVSIVICFVIGYGRDGGVRPRVIPKPPTGVCNHMAVEMG